MTYLPSTVEATVAKASQKVSDAQSKASETVYRTRERASSFLTTIRDRSGTLTSRDDIPRPPQFDPDRLSIDTRYVIPWAARALLVGSFTNHMDKILAILDHPPTPCGQAWTFP